MNGWRADTHCGSIDLPHGHCNTTVAYVSEAVTAGDQCVATNQSHHLLFGWPRKGHFDYEAPFAENPDTFLNDYTSMEPPDTLKWNYRQSKPISRGPKFLPLRGADPNTIKAGLPDGNPVLSSGLQPIVESIDAPLREVRIGPGERHEWLVKQHVSGMSTSQAGGSGQARWGDLQV